MLLRFHFQRDVDVSGCSGCGKVAEGVLIEDTGEVMVRWFGEHSSINIYHSMDDVIWIHGHQNKTHIVWDDETNKK